MALAELEQASSLIKRSQNTLLVVPEKPSLDAFASMVALYLALVETEKVTAVSPSHVPAVLQFLPGSSQVVTTPTLQPEVTLDIAGPEQSLAIRQEPLRGGLRLHITFPEHTALSKDQLETSVRSLPYDLAIIIGAADLEELGPVFSDHTDFFYNTPIVNTDHRAKNEHFGTVNLVDITACSSAEVVYNLIQRLSDAPLSGDISTALYAGIVAATNSFQSPVTSPQSFHIAAQLMESGANKEAVIHHVVKTKPLKLLKLLGRIYARLQHEEEGGLYWSLLRPHDFEASRAEPDNIPDTIHELVNSIAGFNAVFVMHEIEPGVHQIYLVLGKGLQSRRSEIQAQLEAHRQNGALIFQLSTPSLEVAEKSALEKVRAILP